MYFLGDTSISLAILNSRLNKGLLLLLLLYVFTFASCYCLSTGIRSQSKPNDIMGEVYRAMMSLGYVSTIIRIFLVVFSSVVHITEFSCFCSPRSGK